MNVLNKSSEMVNLIYREIEQVHKQIAGNKDVIQFIFNPHLEVYPRNLDILNMLGNISATNEYIESIYIYGSHSKQIIHSNGKLYSLDEFPDTFWIPVYEKSRVPIEWLGTRRVTEDTGFNSNVITSICNIPFRSESKMGAVVINIKERMIYAAIKGDNAIEHSEIFALSSAGIVISHRDENRLYDFVRYRPYLMQTFSTGTGSYIADMYGMKSLFAFTTSPHNNWKYVYRIPLDHIQNDSHLVLGIILAITLIYIALSMFISLAISRGIYNPVANLIKIILVSQRSGSESSLQKPITNEYKFLEQIYCDVIDQNRNLEQRLTELKPLIKEKLFSGLVKGGNENMRDISEKLNFLGYDLSLNNYLVIALQIDDYHRWYERYGDIERNLQKLRLIATIEKIIMLHAKGVCIEVKPDKLVAIINYDGDGKFIVIQENSVSFASEIKKIIENNFPFTVTLGIGRIYKNILDINLSYKEAMNALKYKLYQGKNEIIDISDIEIHENELYLYHSEKERTIINKLKTGNHREAVVEIDELMKEIYENGNISYDYLENIFIRITSSIAEVLIDTGISVDEVFGTHYNLYDELSQRETLEDIGAWLKRISFKLTHAINEHNLKRLDRNVEKIIAYIDDHLQEDISLNSLAELVGFSTSYISKIFKENIGINYIEYLSKKRIEKSKLLLKDTIFNIKEIGFRVGFNNIQTFLRTFKRHEGITPGQYRENIRNSGK
ncbi:helix-turn-helix domain-containing protein [Marispirochaeta aestuarii]|nr:helix-turn-helix domain-containing protein [Marispirochaeta aestuarii]